MGDGNETCMHRLLACAGCLAITSNIQAVNGILVVSEKVSEDQKTHLSTYNNIAHACLALLCVLLGPLYRHRHIKLSELELELGACF